MKEMYEAAADWWAERLRVAPVKDNGDAGQSVIGTYEALQAPELMEEEIQSFRDAIFAMLEEGQLSYSIISTDYGPDPFLSRAIERATDGFGNERAKIVGSAILERLPWKTIMVLKDGKVQIAAGYGASLEAIYPPPFPPEIPIGDGGNNELKDLENAALEGALQFVEPLEPFDGEVPGEYVHRGWVEVRVGQPPEYSVEWRLTRDGKEYALGDSVDAVELKEIGEQGLENRLRGMIQFLHSEGRLLPAED